MTISKLFSKKSEILIGMIHLPPLLSCEGFAGIDPMIEGALADLRALQEAGFDGALIENDNDKPHTEFANEAQIANLTIVASEVMREARIPIGVQMMLNDWRSSFSIAKAVNAQFTRLDVFVDHVTCEWGEINPNPDEIIALKNSLYPELLLLSDIQVKYKTMVTPRPLSESAALALAKGADGLIITGTATGVETPLDSIRDVRAAFPDASLFVGAGVSKDNVAEQLAVANGAIIGTSIKTGNRVDVEKATVLRKLLS